MTGNPSFNTYPETPPGLAGVPYMVGGLVAPLVGGVAKPYVPENQSTYDAWTAKYINDPAYKAYMARQYGQYGRQIMQTAGNAQIVQNLASMSGYSTSQIKKDMAGFGEQFGSSMIGGFVMPLADSFLDRVGVSGGSFVDAANTVFSNRMSLISPLEFTSPFNPEQQHRMMAGSAAAASMMNGFISRRTKKDGDMSVMPDMKFTQGFGRDKVAKLFMMQANAGMYNEDGKGIQELLQEAAGDFDISNLDASRGDFDVGNMTAEEYKVSGKDSNLDHGSDEARKIANIARVFKSKMEAGIQAMGAMRDMLKEVDGIEEKLTAITNGDWLRSTSGAYEARDSVRNLNAVAQAYNLDPKKAMGMIFSNRGLLQDAAGIDGNMRFFGFDGGGMFGLKAQTAILEDAEGVIKARGLQGDPIMADRIRKQRVQLMARNMNTFAGRAAQALAYGRQTGMLSEEEADSLRAAMTSGDRGKMEDAVNRLLITEFGSSKKGREMLNNKLYVDMMRQNMNGDAGLYANRMIMQGADREFMQREKITAAENRLAFSKDILADVGMRVNQSDEGIDLGVNKVVESLKDTGYADSFKKMFTSMVDRGMSRQSALNATVSAFENNAATAKYSEQVQLALNTQFAENNERTFVAEGSESGQAKAMLEAMNGSRAITGKQFAEGMKMIREGNGANALSYAQSLNSGLAPELQKMTEGARQNAVDEYNSAVDAIQDKAEVSQLIDEAGKSGYNSEAVMKSFNAVVDAAKRFEKSDKSVAAQDEYYDSIMKSNFKNIFGEEKFEEIDDIIRSGNKDEISKLTSKLGRQSFSLGQIAEENLAGNGYSMVESGYYGGGLYGGNSRDIDQRRGQFMADLANSMQQHSQYSADDRKTFAQDFVDMMTGEGDWKSLLKIYDPSGKMQEVGAEYFDKFKEYEEMSAKFDTKHSKDVKDVIRGLNRGRKYKEASALQTMFDNAGQTVKDANGDEHIIQWKDVEKFAETNNLTPDQITKLKEAYDVKAKSADLKRESETLAKEVVNKDGYLDAAKSVHMNKVYRESRKGRLDDAAAFIDSLDYDVDFKGETKSAYKKAMKAVSDEEVSKSLDNIAIKDLDAGLVKQTRLKILKEKAAAGDEKAVAAMEQFKVAANDGVQRVRGELVIKQGNEQAPATLDGNMGPM